MVVSALSSSPRVPIPDALSSARAGIGKAAARIDADAGAVGAGDGGIASLTGALTDFKMSELSYKANALVLKLADRTSRRLIDERV